MSDSPSPTFLGFEIVCDNFDKCHAHRSCRNFRAGQKEPKKPDRNEYIRKYRKAKRAERASSQSQTAAA
jgi:hypothetical protein